MKHRVQRTRQAPTRIRQNNRGTSTQYCHWLQLFIVLLISLIVLSLCQGCSPLRINSSVYSWPMTEVESSLQTTSISVVSVTADVVTVTYSSLPGNQPNTYNNFVAIWEATAIPWQAEPLRRLTIPGNGQMGSIAIDGVMITDNAYIVGYGVGPDIANICVSASIGAISNGLEPPANVKIDLLEVNPGFVRFRYETLAGYLPHTCNNWVGLWPGYVSPYNAPQFMGQADIPLDSTVGELTIRNVKISPGIPYTLIYFVGTEKKTQLRC